MIFVPQVDTVADTEAIKVMGAVKSPGRFNWNVSMTFLDVLALAGGPLQQANITNIRIIKENRQSQDNVLYFDLDNFINEGGSFAALPRLTAGDTIVIDELPHDPTDNKSSWIRQSADDSIYVFGQVGAPGAMPSTVSWVFSISYRLQTGRTAMPTYAKSGSATAMTIPPG